MTLLITYVIILHLMLRILTFETSLPSVAYLCCDGTINCFSNDSNSHTERERGRDRRYVSNNYIFR